MSELAGGCAYRAFQAETKWKMFFHIQLTLLVDTPDLTLGKLIFMNCFLVKAGII